jgi:hypothetical protein
MFSSLLYRLQGRCLHAAGTVISRRCLRLAPAQFVGGLPALGSVLYVPMRPRMSSTWEMPTGLLVEMMQLAPLLQVRWVVAASSITSEGPREWIECVDREGQLCARLHLLPDTDYLAWDALLASGEPMPVPRPAHWPRDPRPASAQLLHFHMRRLGGLHVLGGEGTPRISILGRHLAAQIAHAEALSLQP